MNLQVLEAQKREIGGGTPDFWNPKAKVLERSHKTKHLHRVPRALTLEHPCPCQVIFFESCRTPRNNSYAVPASTPSLSILFEWSFALPIFHPSHGFHDTLQHAVGLLTWRHEKPDPPHSRGLPWLSPPCCPFSRARWAKTEGCRAPTWSRGSRWSRWSRWSRGSRWSRWSRWSR